MRKPGKRMASVIASIAAVCVMTGGIGYQAAVSGAQTDSDSTENSVKNQDTDQQESADGSFSEEGTTQIGTVSQMPEFTVNAVTMTVEEVYVSSGDTMSKGDAAVEEKKEAYDEAVKQISEYQTKIDNNDYYVECGIDEKKAAVDAATTALTQAQQSADAAQSALEQAQKEFDSAVETYNKNVEETNTKITELTDSLDDLKSDYEQAERDATTQKTELQNEYDTAVVEGKYAGSTYQSTVSELESAVESAQDTLDTLKEEQTALLALENGVVTADEDGTIASVPYEAEDILKTDTAFALYCDTQTIMISVEVPQENIAQIGVGDEVSVMIAGNRDGAVTGTVSSIASSATTGGSVSDVTYAVIISINNSDGTVEKKC